MKINLKTVVVIPKPIYDEIIRELETYEANMQEIYIKSESSYFEPTIDVRCFIEKLKYLLKLEEKPCKLFKPNLKEAGVVVSQDLFSKLNEIDKLRKHVGDIEKQMLEASEEVEVLKTKMEVMQSEFRSKEH